MPNIGVGEWIFIFLIVLVIFGPKALPKIGQSLGQGIRELKDALSGVSKELENDDKHAGRIENSAPRGTSANAGDADNSASDSGRSQS